MLIGRFRSNTAWRMAYSRKGADLFMSSATGVSPLATDFF